MVDESNIGMQTIARINRGISAWIMIAMIISGACTANASANTGHSGAHDSWEPFVDVGVVVPARDIRRKLAPHGATMDAIESDVVKFYSDRAYRPVWIGGGSADEMAASVVNAIGHADDQGLNRADYDTYLARWQKQTLSGSDRDIALTRALFHYAHDVRLGRFRPDQVYADVRLPSLYYDVGPPLADAVKQQTMDAFLADLPPPQQEYRNLVDALAHYREIATHGGFPVVSGGGKAARQSLIRRLSFEDVMFASGGDASMDEITEAIKQFQERNGLPADGKLGADTLAALNVPVSTHIHQIVANLERWRWMPREFERRFVRVNVPDQSVDFVKDGRVVLHSKVIIGTKDTPTPILRTEIKSVVANPPWDIPGDLVLKKILPRLRKDPTYLKSREMTLVDGPADDPYGTKINWASMDTHQMPALQQAPGSDNALGALMLDMPNDFDVYLHDTPNKKKFDAATREFSNGCVRVEKIMTLASLVLSGSPDDAIDKLKDAIATHQTKTIDLDDVIPVYMEYWTAVAETDGSVGFRPDRYNRDGVLLARLAAPPPKLRVKVSDVGQTREAGAKP
jgi:murein L,D-transpeptidase YcbB/YkuD